MGSNLIFRSFFFFLKELMEYKLSQLELHVWSITDIISMPIMCQELEIQRGQKKGKQHLWSSPYFPDILTVT